MQPTLPAHRLPAARLAAEKGTDPLARLVSATLTEKETRCKQQASGGRDTHHRRLVNTIRRILMEGGGKIIDFTRTSFCSPRKTSACVGAESLPHNPQRFGQNGIRAECVGLNHHRIGSHLHGGRLAPGICGIPCF